MAERHNNQSATADTRPRSLDARRANPRMNYPPVPMDECRAEVVECVRNNQNAVIIGETGSGKTTRIPDFLLDEFPDAKVAITQPRRVAARSVARYVAGRRGGRVGEEIGYQVRFEDKTTEGTRANFMTDGILLRKLQFDPLLQEYDIVMVDEAHERNLNIDFVLGLLKRVQAERKKKGMQELKVIATSATIEKEKFANYFGGSPVVEVPGRMHPVDVQYAREEVRDYPKAAAQRVKEIVTSGAQGDVLIFMPGEEEIRRTIQEIEALNLSCIDAMPLFGAMAPEDQDRIFEKNPKRKVIVSTNIAETSVTIDGVRFVIDSGLIKQKEFNPDTGIEALLTKHHAKSGCEQRKGRAGRTAPGTCYRLYTEEEYNNREAYQTPEIARSNLDHVILAMKKIGIEDVRSFDFIDRPKEEAITQAIETLKMLGALDANEKLTKIGETMAELPLRPEIARMVIEAEKYKCTGKICTIAAMMGEKSVFVRPKEKEHEADAAQRQFTKNGSDFLKLLEVWQQWSAAGFDEHWARDHFLNVCQLFEVREIRSQLMRELKRQKIAVDDVNGNDPIAIQKCVASGMIQHLLIDSGRHSYKRVIRGSSDSGRVFIHPSSAAFSQAPQLMIGADVVTTSKTFARRCQPVKPEWLPEIAPQLLEEKNRSLRYDPETDSVLEKVGYSLRGHYDTIAEQERPATDDKIITEQFIRVLAEGHVDLPCVKHNADAVRALQTLQTRSGGRVPVPELSAWYKERAGGVRSRQEARYIDEQLRINFDDHCPPEMKAEIDRLYPETIEVRGRALKVEYEYRPANAQAYYESEKNEKFKATITSPGDIIFQLNPDDFPVLGSGGRPEIHYRFGDGYNSITNSDLEALKEAADKKQSEDAWYSFKKPETEPIETQILQPLPSLDSIGARPIAYTKNYKGEDVFAYPSYHAEQTYDYQNGEYKYKFRVTYYRTEAEAKQNNERALEVKKQEDDKARRKAERETLLAPAKEKYAGMRPEMEQLSSAYSNYGISYDDYYRLQEKWREAGYTLESSDADPKKAIGIMDEIQAALANGRQERERRIALIPAVQARVDALADKMGKITYDTYTRFGLSYEQFNAISSKYREANDALKTTDRYNSPTLPDPERAAKIIDELIGMIPDEQEFTPEQESLMSILSSRDSGYAKVIRVRGGKVIEYFSPNNPGETTAMPDKIPIGGSGRALLVRGSRLVFVFGSGNEGGSWKLSDGDYLFDRDARTVLRVEEKQSAPHGLRAIELVQSSYDEPVDNGSRGREKNSRPYYEAKPADTGERLGAGVFASLLGKIADKQEAEPKKPTPVAPIARETAKPVEKEKMTEELRATLANQLANARFFLESVRAVPEPDKKATNSDKISKVRAKAAELKRELNGVEQELSTTDNATRARGQVAEIVRKAERAAAEISRLQNSREDWPDRFKTFITKLAEVAKAQDVALDNPTLDKIRPKVAELSKRKGEIVDLAGEVETIIIDSI
ncbi:MAG: DEAD/DEAH box helicase [Candidatus Magasanikbacteria bacterium]|nr:DEAD/DEAH box helicase [Candidatus Magasanikbacteria bacterium]